MRIGCSGWQYRHWRGSFYPVELPQKQWFDYYAAHFDTVEINNTFYRLPEPSTFNAWKSRAPRGFLYAINIVYTRLSRQDVPFTGWAPIMMLILIIGGLIMLMLGIIGEYVWRIYDEVKRKPNYVLYCTFEHIASDASI